MGGYITNIHNWYGMKQKVEMGKLINEWLKANILFDGARAERRPGGKVLFGATRFVR